MGSLHRCCAVAACLLIVAAGAGVAEAKVRLPVAHRLPSLPLEATACPCADPELCKPSQAVHAKEVFGFGGGNWQWFDWTVVTTVAWSSDPALICHAHSVGARVIAGAPGDMPLTANATARREWVDKVIANVQALHLDGVTFDKEDPMNKTQPERDFYTTLVRETTAAMHAALPGSQVSVCVPWSPNGIDGRQYDFVGLAAGADLLYGMFYDERSQIFDRCIASANSALPLARLGISQFLQLGVAAHKLVLGVPWYGYRYPCEDTSDPAAEYCPIRSVPFRGVACSDAAGSEIAYSAIMRLLAGGNATTPRRYDPLLESPYFNYVEKGQLYQMWYDDPESLSAKYRFAKELGLRGVGPFTYSDVDPKAKAESAAMWKALHIFTSD